MIFLKGKTMVEYFQENFTVFTEMGGAGKYVVIAVGLGLFFLIKYLRSYL